MSASLVLTETVSFTHDLSLADQVDCEADPDNRLCDGQSLQSTGLHSLRYTFNW